MKEINLEFPPQVETAATGTGVDANIAATEIDRNDPPVLPADGLVPIEDVVEEGPTEDESGEFLEPPEVEEAETPQQEGAGGQPPSDLPPTEYAEDPDDDRERSAREKLAKAEAKLADIAARQGRQRLSPEDELIAETADTLAESTEAAAPAAQPPGQEDMIEFVDTVRAIVDDGRVGQDDTTRKFAVSNGTEELGVNVAVSYTDSPGDEEDEPVARAEIRIDLDLMADENTQPLQSVVCAVTKRGDEFTAEKTVPPSLKTPEGQDTSAPTRMELTKYLGEACIVEGYEQEHQNERVPDAIEGEQPPERPWRVQSELEQANPEIQPLPPTPITKGAQARLESWGVTQERVGQLRDITSSLRYDLPDERAATVAEHGGYVTQDTDGNAEVVLPNFYEAAGSLAGECASLTVEHHKLLHGTGYMTALNEELAGKGERLLELVHVTGYSRTHFTQEGQRHVWTGLLPEGADLSELVTVDASFQEISMTAQNGYTPQEIRRVANAQIMPAASVKVGRFEERGDDFGITLHGSALLGLSADQQLTYGLTFIEDADQIRPAIVVDGVRPGSESVCFVQGEEVVFMGAPQSERQQMEVAGMLIKLQDMPLVFDARQAQIAKEDSYIINIGEQ